MAVITGDPCKVLDALAALQYDVLRRLNRKFNALRRLAQQLELLGDIAGLIPNLPALLPLASINLDIYERLRINCPFLNLPLANNATLAELQQKVRLAYTNLVKKLLNHPHLRMNKLQDRLTKLQNEVNLALATGTDWTRCLQTICDTIGQVGSAFNKISTANVQKEIAAFTDHFVTQAGQILTEPARQKYAQTVDAISQLKALGADVGTDYNDAKALATA